MDIEKFNLLKAHVEQHTRKDGTVVQAHDDKRVAAAPQATKRAISPADVRHGSGEHSYTNREVVKRASPNDESEAGHHFAEFGRHLESKGFSLLGYNPRDPKEKTAYYEHSQTGEKAVVTHYKTKVNGVTDHAVYSGMLGEEIPKKVRAHWKSE